MKASLKIVTAMAMAVLLAGPCLAQTTLAVDVNVNAVVSLDVTISPISVSDGSWGSPVTSVDFGTLTLDTAVMSYKADNYYAADINISVNTGAWTFTHTTSPVTNGTENLDNHINVTFMQQITDSMALPLAYHSYATSNTFSYVEPSALTKWIRIYYSIANGSTDNPGVSVIDSLQPAGTYTGTVTLAVTPD